MDPKVFRSKVLNTLHVQELFFQRWINGSPGIQVESIEYFACARSIYFLSWIDWPQGIRVQSIEYFERARSIFLSWIEGPQVFRCKVLNTFHVQKVFFRSWINGPSRYLGAKYWILCTCKKYFFQVGCMDPQVFRCKVLNTLHVQEVFF